ncbi:MAG: hypothetical protein HeimC3_39150 [Candidatus Heimdallarchaeota archaeon LC_3]|nr:MAG: hypothetical protein HeimC3_39150 [Candidatus Heimdallarchaeota archaeon LC_3]
MSGKNLLKRFNNSSVELISTVGNELNLSLMNEELLVMNKNQNNNFDSKRCFF